MSNWYEVFDNEAVQWHARRQATRLTAVAAGAVMLTLAGAAMTLDGWLPLPSLGAWLLLIWYLSGRWIVVGLRKLRRVVWCIKLSAERVVGYDYTRRNTVLAWQDVCRVDLAKDGLLLVGAAHTTFEIPHLFPDFATLSHRVLHYAEQNGVPVFINGQPWQALDVYQFFPFLVDDSSADMPSAG